MLIIAGIISLTVGLACVALATPIRKSSPWETAWNEPRRFFAWLTLFSLSGSAAGYVIFANTNSLQTAPAWQGHTLLSATAICLAGFVLGFGCLILAWIPPVRRLLAWLLQRRFYVLACLVTLVALFYAEENWRGKRAWDNYRREWEAQGERFDFASIIPPPVPDEQNFALTPIVYSSYASWLDKQGQRKQPFDTNVVNRLTMSIYREGDYGKTNLNLGSWQKANRADLRAWQDYYRHPKVGVTNDFPVSPQPQSPAADVLLALSRYDSAIEELRAAAKLPYSRYPLNYDSDKPFDILIPHLAKIKGVTFFLNLRILAELEAGQPDQAFADLKLAFRWNDSIRNEAFLITHLVRIAVQNILMQSVWQGLAEHKWSDTQIAELEKELGKLDYLADFHQSIRGERNGSIAMIEHLRQHRDYNELIGTGSMDRSMNKNYFLEMINAIGWHLSPDGWFYQTELAFAQMHQRWILPVVDLPNRLVSPATGKRLGAGFEKAMPRRPTSVKYILVGMLFPALARASDKYAIIQAQLDLARVACGLERYRLAHGNYPDSLAALAPQFIAAVPHDIINGQPLKYRRTSDGYLLYSVGRNDKDDGGTVALKKHGVLDPDQGDWVWQIPASQ